jgi:hypothetical protein
MAKAIQVKVEGLEKTAIKMQKQKDKVISGVGAALFVEGEKIMAASKPLVPVVTGTLRASGHVQPPQKELGTVFVELGYGGASADYAAKVHENPRAGKTRGVSPRGIPYKRSKTGKPTWSTHGQGQWKYLETPFKAAAPGLPKRIEGFVSAKLRLGV